MNPALFINQVKIPIHCTSPLGTGSLTGSIDFGVRWVLIYPPIAIVASTDLNNNWGPSILKGVVWDLNVVFVVDQWFLHSQCSSVLTLIYSCCFSKVKTYTDYILCLIGVSYQVFEGTSGIDNKYTTVQFTGEVLDYFLLSWDLLHVPI